LLAGELWQNTVHVEGYRNTPGEDMNPGFNQVMPGFFSTMGVPLLMGRDFTDRDVEGAPKVVIVNETFLKRFCPDGKPLGRHIGWGDGGPMPMEIVGVVRDLKGIDLRETEKAWTFTPALQNAAPSEMTFYVRSKQDPRALVQAAQRMANRLDSSLPVYNVKTIEMQIEETHFLDRLFVLLSAAFAVLATLLASIGLYGVTAYNATRRTQEMGIRVALGAERTDILRLVMREVLWLTAIGIAAGGPLAVALGKLVQNELYGMKASDPAVMIAAVVVITSVSALAAYLPARRASRIDPMRALRYE
jgi:predicted permease